ncbi:hypothetical protein F2P81_024304 [Scophthalmus maximus]|uniref:Radial spoke head protein 3-like n=1 Tax=Scophthalmus maximus TaxID=52904 RepID=A0A6A4RZ64_SCOMX|nr:hypothetical protein F2P81_024304 [Scophthalmus maximus]
MECPSNKAQNESLKSSTCEVDVTFDFSGQEVVLASSGYTQNFGNELYDGSDVFPVWSERHAHLPSRSLSPPPPARTGCHRNRTLTVTLTTIGASDPHSLWQMAFHSHIHRDPNGTYTFSSRPRPVENRSKYREAPPEHEVQPVLEVLVGKTIEQSLLEVLEEEELACLRAQQRAYQELRNIELAEVQRLQEQERRHSEERVHRIAQQKEVLEKEREAAEKIAARAYTQQYLADLVPAVFKSLYSHGYFNDPVEKDIETNFFPWLMAEVNNTLERRYTARQLLDNLVAFRFKMSHRNERCVYITILFMFERLMLSDDCKWYSEQVLLQESSGHRYCWIALWWLFVKHCKGHCSVVHRADVDRMHLHPILSVSDIIHDVAKERLEGFKEAKSDE